jgi:hypothetical protein
LNYAVLNAAVVQLDRRLPDDFARMGKRQHALAVSDGFLDDLGGDDGFAAAGRPTTSTCRRPVSTARCTSSLTWT